MGVLARRIGMDQLGVYVNKGKAEGQNGYKDNPDQVKPDEAVP